jgi:hypothetical protein
MKYWAATTLDEPRRQEMSRWCNQSFGYTGWMVHPQFGQCEEECYLKWSFWYQADVVLFTLVWDVAANEDK